MFTSEEEKRSFPVNFLWGASTAAHQVEGNQHNDWTIWEEANAARLARRAAGAYYPNSQNKQEAVNPDNYISNKGKVDHWQRYPEDLEMLRGLGLNAYRFSVEWSRIQPGPNAINRDALAHYREMLLEMRKRKIVPVLTLWHFTLPVWVAEKGGWSNPQTVGLFLEFTKLVMAELGDLVDYWITINEPGVYASQSYLHAKWPPQKKNPLMAFDVLYQFARAHAEAYDYIKSVKPDAKVSLAHNMCYYEPARDTLLNRLMLRFFRWWHNDQFIELIHSKLDFIGLNHYFHEKVSGLKRFADQEKRSDLNWGLSPQALFPLLVEIHKKHRLPIIITENGLADSRNAHRPWYIDQVKIALRQAIDAGVDLQGYFHWSLLDNFEWAEGYWPKFGLIEIDQQSGARRPRI